MSIKKEPPRVQGICQRCCAIGTVVEFDVPFGKPEFRESFAVGMDRSMFQRTQKAHICEVCAGLKKPDPKPVLEDPQEEEILQSTEPDKELDWEVTDLK